VKKPAKKKTVGSAPPRARIPLPRKTEKSHGDAKKFDRKKQKETLRREFDLD